MRIHTGTQFANNCGGYTIYNTLNIPTNTVTVYPWNTISNIIEVRVCSKDMTSYHGVQEVLELFKETVLQIENE